MTRPNLTRQDLETSARQSLDDRIREGVKALLEQILEEEMTAHLQAEYWERSPLRRGERNGHYQRDLITPVGKIEQLQVPRDREGQFLTEVFERYQRMTGNVEEAVLEMYLQGVSTRKWRPSPKACRASLSARTPSAASPSALSRSWRPGALASWS